MVRRDRDRDILWQSSGLSFLAFASVVEARAEAKPAQVRAGAMGERGRGTESRA